MRVRLIALAAALAAIAGCDRGAQEGRAQRTDAPIMAAPSTETEPARSYQANSESARAATGRVTVTMTTRMSADEKENTGPVEYLTLNAETGLSAEAMLDGGVRPSVTVEGQTIRALMDLDVSVSSLRVYRITAQVTPRGGRGLCSEGEATRLVVWESQGPGEQVLKMLALGGEGAPGAASSRICAAYAYTRNAA